MIRCLIVDDNASFLDAATSMLERGGVALVGTARTVEQTLRRTGELQPDAVLVDIMLGDESGFQVARRIAEYGLGAAVIFISTHAEGGSDRTDRRVAGGRVCAKSQLSAATVAASSASLEICEDRKHAALIVFSLRQRGFARILRTCFSTVPSVTQSLRAMPELERPLAMSPSTSRSRALHSPRATSWARRRLSDQLEQRRFLRTTYLINHLRIPNEVPNEGGLEYLAQVEATFQPYGGSGLCSANTTKCSRALARFGRSDGVPGPGSCESLVQLPRAPEVLHLRTDNAISNVILVDQVAPGFTSAGVAERVRAAVADSAR